MRSVRNKNEILEIRPAGDMCMQFTSRIADKLEMNTKGVGTLAEMMVVFRIPLFRYLQTHWNII